MKTSQASQTPKASVFGKPQVAFTAKKAQPAGLRLKGYISAPGEFYEKRKETHFRRGTESNAYLLFDHEKNTITLRVSNEQGDYDEIVGQFLPHSLLTLMNYETGDVFSAKDLVDYIINNSQLFDRDGIYAAAVDFFSKPCNCVTTSKGDSAEEEVFDFTITLPLYKGSNRSELELYSISVVKFTTKEGTFCYLESSMWIKSHLESLRDSVFEKEKERFKDFVCIDC